MNEFRILLMCLSFFLFPVLNIYAQNEVPKMMQPEMIKGALNQKAEILSADVTEWIKVDDMEGSGSYPATYEMAKNGPLCVVYQPQKLAPSAKDKKFGIYIWGNGGCSFNGAGARFHLTEIASRGFIAIAPGKILSGPNSPDNSNGLEEAEKATAKKMIEALDWILAENKRVESPYFQLIDTARVAIGGNSCGGIIALQASLDSRVKALVLQNSGVLPSTVGFNSELLSFTKKDLSKLHVPVLYITGGPQDVAQPNALDDFERINHVPVFIADHPGMGHLSSVYEPNAEATKVEIDWLLWQLDGDELAAHTFVGVNCELCRDYRWVVYRKGDLW